MDPVITNHRLRISPSSVIHIHRRFQSGKGTVAVKIDQVVSPEDILGVGELISGFKIINLPATLGIKADQGLNYLQKKVTDTIYKGELIAKVSGLFGLNHKYLIADTDGVINAYNHLTGDLLVSLLPKKEQLVSGVYGVVDAINKLDGTITIRTMATVIYGMVGTGRERVGLIKNLGSPDLLVSSKQINGVASGQILIGGSTIFLDALQKGVNNHVVGFLCGGMDAVDFKTIFGGNLNLAVEKFIDVGVTLILTEGFGTLPMGPDIFAVLTTFEGKFAVIDGRRSRMILPSQDSNSLEVIKKTILPLSDPAVPVSVLEPGIVKIGDHVRLLSPTVLAKQGIVIAIDNSATMIPSGIFSQMVTVETKSGKMKVPYQNLEVI